MGSPVNRVSSLSKQGASSCPSSPVPSSKPDRSADYAAVRNLAESYGVDLLPLEMGFTPLRTQVKSAEKAAQRFSTADSGADFPNTPDVGETASSAAGGPAGRTLDAVYSGGSTASIGMEADGTVQGRSSSPSKATGAPSAAAPASANQQLQVSSSGEALAGYPIDVDSGSELNTDSPSGVADFVDGEGAGAEGVYLDEEQLPIEERVTLLEEERDMLVDKLLDTTAALHASEARNRQSEASQCQVQALLEQLQELLRRAEVERDRAKMQLKRHRASNSGFLFGSAPGSMPTDPADTFTIGSLGARPTSAETVPAVAGLVPSRPRTKKYKASSRGGAPPGEDGTASSGMLSSAPSSSGATGAAAAEAGAEAVVAALDTAQQQQSVGAAAAARPAGDAPTAAGRVAAEAAGEGLAAVASIGSDAVAAAGSKSRRSSATNPDSDASTPAATKRASSSSIAALGLPGSRRSSNGSSCSSSDAVSPGDAKESAVTLTPSTDEARPPVRSVISGFEALLHRQRAPKASPGSSGSGGGRSRERGLSGSDSRSASPMASRGGTELAPAELPLQLPVTAPEAEPAATEETPTALQSHLPKVEDFFEQAAAAAELAPVPVLHVEAIQAEAEGQEAAGSAVAAAEAHKKTYVDAAVAGAEAERTRRSGVGIGVRAASSGSRLGAGAGSNSSTASTPTAAALCNTVPLGSYMLDNCNSEEEDEVAVLHPGQAVSPRGTYNPSCFTPVRPVDRLFVGPTEGGSSGGRADSLPGTKRGRTSSPAASPTAEHLQEHDLAATAVAGAGGDGVRQSRGLVVSSPGSAFGSVISCEAGSPSVSVTGGANSSCPGSVTPVDGSSSGGGSSRGKARSASRLGTASSSAGAEAPAAAGAAADNGAKEKPRQQQKGSKEQGREHAAKSSNGGRSNSSNGSKLSPRPSMDSTAEVRVTSQRSTGKAHHSAAAAGNGKANSKKASAPAQQSPAAATDSSSKGANPSTASARMGKHALLLMFLAALVVVAVVVGYLLMTIWQKDAQVQQLKQQLSQHGGSCASGLDAAAPARDL